MTDEANCPLPKPLDYKAVKTMYSQVRKDTNYKLSPENNRREAARRLGTDYDTFSNVLATKGVGFPATSTPSIVVKKVEDTTAKALADDPQKLAYDAGWEASKRTKTFDMESAEARFEAKNGSVTGSHFAAGWTDHASGYDKYTLFNPTPKKPTVPTTLDTRTINGVLNDLGFAPSTETAVRRTHTGAVYGGGSSRTKGYVTREINGEVHISYYNMNAYGDDIPKAMDKMRERLMAEGYVVASGLTRTQIIVRLRPSSA